jgi:Ser/Thr protein kinase RdoA (MazF antagonist)
MRETDSINLFNAVKFDGRRLRFRVRPCNPTNMTRADLILPCYDLAGPLHAQPLGNHGGFSGAHLWRVSTARGEYCLRAWPADMTAERIEFIHEHMLRARRAGLAFVPNVLSTWHGATFVAKQDRLWDLTTWMPGQADYWQQPSSARLEAACMGLAKLHEAWRPQRPTSKPCPGWLRRQAKALEWRELSQRGCPAVSVLDPVAEMAKRAWARLMALGPWLQAEVAKTSPIVLVQPCLCDVWHDHILFSGAEVTGVIDYGSMKEDNFTVDLARLLGSLVEDDEACWTVGLAAYQRVRPLTQEEINLTRSLDQTGTMLAAANWLRWLLVDNRAFDNRQRIAERLQRLVERLERIGATFPSASRSFAARFS